MYKCFLCVRRTKARTKMVSYPQTGKKFPVRPAPAPPSSRPNRIFQRSSSFFDSWDDGNDPFSNGNISRSFSAQNIGPAQTVKKKPPPRPPPPKLNNQRHHPTPNSKQNRTNVIAGLFSRPNQRSYPSTLASHKQGVGKDHTVHVASLIDFDSPSSSPTFTTRSSSDGVSVNSFGSDGSASNNGNTPSGGTASLFESGFEDDFDFFGGLSNSNMKIPVSEQKDPWGVSSQDPFSPSTIKHQETFSKSGNSSWFNDASGNMNHVPNHVDVLKPPSVTSVMPTIIRAKPNRPTALPKQLQSSNESAKQTNVGLMQNSSLFFNNTDIFDSSKPFSSPFIDPGSSHEWSPPMPSVPPPPPPENINPDDIPITLPDLPPRKSPMSNKKIPHGIALYDYSTPHPDDLTFQCNDIIHILKKINNEWLYGEIGNRQGMFPANFIEVIVPLDASSESSVFRSGLKIVTALYPFSAQQWDDLDFPEGAVIEVLSQINSDWLYGEYQGKKGQFPSSFVDHIPPGLTQRKLS